jgi:hypothetical protein
MKKRTGLLPALLANILPGLAMACVVLVVPLYGQVERASIVGTVTDSSGGAMPGVQVEVTNEATNTTTRLVTDSAGSYSAVNLIPGSYTVGASLQGFQPKTFRNYVLQVSQRARLDITLAVGGLEQAIDVTAVAPLLQTENASIGQVISSEAVNALPLNGRNFVQLAILAPGVTGLDYAQQNTINSGRRPDELRPGGTTLQANGASSWSNQVLIDGIDNTEMISQTFVVRPTVEGIQEFRVLTNNAGARPLGGRSGSDHDEVGRQQLSWVCVRVLPEQRTGRQELLRKSGFGQASLPPEPVRRKSRRARRKEPHILLRELRRLPGGLRRHPVGDGSHDGHAAGKLPGCDGKRIYDPMTTRPNPNGSGVIRDRFPNDIIPPERWDRIGATLINLYPAPQNSALFNNYVANPKKVSSLHRADGRIDHQLAGGDTLFGRYSIDRAFLTIPDTFNTDIGGSPASFAGDNDVKGQNMVGSWTRLLSSDQVLEVRYGYTQYDMALIPTQLTNALWQTIPGRNNSDPYQPTAPIIDPSDRVGLGNARSTPLIRNQHMHEVIANMNWQRGSHNILFGADIRWRRTSETASPPGQSAFGRWNFGPAWTRNPLSTGGTGDTMAAMLLGFPDAIVRDVFTPGTAVLRAAESNFYIRDEWRAKRNLTLNIGLHYEINTPFVEDDDVWANFDPATGTQLLAGLNGVSRTGNIKTDYLAIGPRVGFAYTPQSKMVVRGGFGIFYAPQGNAATNIRQFRQPPFGFQVNVPINTNGVPVNRLTDGFPTVVTTPNLTQGPPIYTLMGVDPDYRNAQMMQFNLAVQRELDRRTVVTLGYVGSLGRYLAWARPLNAPDPGPGALDPRRPYINYLPGVANINWLESSGTSEYNSMQVSLERRFDRGFYLLSNWTWAKGFDNAGGDGGAGGPVPQDPLNRDADWGPSNSDIRHRVNVAGTWELPFGMGRKWLSEENIASYVLGGWDFSGIMVFQTGLPFTVTAPGSPTNTGRGGRADVVSGQPLYPENQTISQWFNPAAFSTPTAFNWGNSSRNMLRGPARTNVDLTLAKRFRLGEQRVLTFRTEVFNAFNTPQFALPAAAVGSGNIATITSTARASRQIQLALRLTF